MFSVWDRQERPPEEGTAAGLQGFGVDKTFLSSLKGILLETELALTFIIFICFTASISAYMAAALLEFFITLAFLFLYATQCYQRFDRLNWPCLGSKLTPLKVLDMCLGTSRAEIQSLRTRQEKTASLGDLRVMNPSSILQPLLPLPLAPQDFLRCLSAIIIFLVVSFAAVTSREGAAIAAFVFGIILVSVFAYDAFKIYRTELMPRTTEGDQQ
ncbi:CKLF-like MARVEL transmembrane domain-containing protein 5 isoform X3 [Rattus norvegicus]|uniref:CKLF-like MARVEL transmembrane domain containing 5 n=1 Tax=Rattus norvegicus TaxID=10116 RepID=D3ZQ46_RAT